MIKFLTEQKVSLSRRLFEARVRDPLGRRQQGEESRFHTAEANGGLRAILKQTRPNPQDPPACLGYWGREYIEIRKGVHSLLTLN